MPLKFTALAAFVAAVRAQQACTVNTETQTSVTWQQCDSSGCTNVAGSVVLDSNWRWTHTVQGTTNCYDGNTWDTTVCPDPETCSQACCVDGGDYPTTYGINAAGNSVDLTFVTTHAYGTNIGSRVYLMQDQDNYQMFDLLDMEFTFDVDVSNLPCGLNGAVYFVSMEQDGGLSSYQYNNAGARYGTGYCDSQCPRDIKFVGGLANVDGWNPSSNDANAGLGDMGACCSEMDIWEANSLATAFTPHPCSTLGYHVCEGDSCGGTYSSDRYAGSCDPDGCDFNPWRQGNETYYGPGSGFTVDTNQPMTVVTQFLTHGTGSLSEIKRFYVQNGQVIANADSIVPPSGNSITTDFCDDQKAVFGDIDTFTQHGGMAQMGNDMSAMVLVLSLWDDHYANMLWLDSTYPIDDTSPGAERGPCPTDSGVPSEVEAEYPNANVVFSNIKFGTIGSTFDDSDPEPSGTTTTSPPVSTTTTTPPPSSTTSGGGGSVPLYGQCGGNNYNGPTGCATGCCQAWSEWYHQCIPGPCS